ncbi:hypothetical protein HAX54_009967 [Datura stramonium]|uniref:Uncharacterized protein n=1 Tax=Datura stramonium TaxID=4076 RepID=A0ABS8TFJ8_DATST|nr:hypothetical protein [Datura stramonium]
MQMLQLRMNGVTEEQLQQLNIDYPLSEHSRSFCRVEPEFKEPLDDDVATDDELTRVDSDIESDDNEQYRRRERRNAPWQAADGRARRAALSYRLAKSNPNSTRN